MFTQGDFALANFLEQRRNLVELTKDLTERLGDKVFTVCIDVGLEYQVSKDGAGIKILRVGTENFIQLVVGEKITISAGFSSEDDLIHLFVRILQDAKAQLGVTSSEQLLAT